MKLNYDIFASVMEYLYRNDLLYMMCTCRTLFNIGIPLFLRELDIITSPSWAETPRLKLYRSLFLENLARISDVTSITGTYLTFLDAHGLPEDYPPGIFTQCRLFPPQCRLPNCLQYFSHLRALDMSMDEYEITPAFQQWILSLTQLRELRLRRVGQQSRLLDDLLQGLRAGIEMVHIGRVASHGVGSSIEPVLALQNVAHTLTALTVEWHDLFVGPRISRPHTTVRLANVLELTWVSNQAVDAALLAWTFPQLRVLRVGDILMDGPKARDVRGITGEHMLALREHHVAQQGQAALFESLESLTGNVLSLWTLGLKCPVTRVETAIRLWEHAKVGHLIVLLHDTAPKHLVLTTYPVHLKELYRVINFASLEAFELRIDVIDETDVLATLVRYVLPLLLLLGIDSRRRKASSIRSTNLTFVGSQLSCGLSRPLWRAARTAVA